jgi:hypothetical protein
MRHRRLEASEREGPPAPAGADLVSQVGGSLSRHRAPAS